MMQMSCIRFVLILGGAFAISSILRSMTLQEQDFVYNSSLRGLLGVETIDDTRLSPDPIVQQSELKATISTEVSGSPTETFGNKMANQSSEFRLPSEPTEAALSEPATTPSVPPRAIVAISMGKSAAASKIVERFVWSARHRGDYDGWIVILTDASLERYAELSDSTHNLIIMNPLPKHYSHEFEYDCMVYKRFKTYMLEYLSLDQRLDTVGLVYYLDIDIVFGNSTKTLFNGLEEKYSIQPSNKRVDETASAYASFEPKMWMFKNARREWRVQGGQMILDRKHSQPCLELWRWHMDNNLAVEKDQVFLNAMYDSHQQARSSSSTSACNIVSMDTEAFIEFPDAPKIENIRSDSTDQVYAPLVHVKNTGNARKADPHAYRRFMRSVLGFTLTYKDNEGLAEKVIIK